jgi:hypothetical protein
MVRTYPASRSGRYWPYLEATLGSSPLANRRAQLRPGAILGRSIRRHPGFVAFAAVAPTIPMTVPIFSAVTSRQFGGSCRA